MLSRSSYSKLREKSFKCEAFQLDSENFESFSGVISDEIERESQVNDTDPQSVDAWPILYNTFN
jgi:hypothetical protein